MATGPRLSDISLLFTSRNSPRICKIYGVNILPHVGPHQDPEDWFLFGFNSPIRPFELCTAHRSLGIPTETLSSVTEQRRAGAAVWGPNINPFGLLFLLLI
ncbi:hypothetical protein ABW19_dt0202722 [Dactylella cylindrospora]|nr:hypothetical protein ABW19_dt0202722 [Dactylella cylindrospora]